MSMTPSPEATQALDAYVREVAEYVFEKDPEREIALEQSVHVRRLRLARLVEAAQRVSATRGMTDGSHDRTRDELDDALEKL